MSGQRSILISSPELIEGIGPQRAAALREVGIETIADMLRAGPARVHKACPGSAAREVGQWFCAAVLMRVQGVDADLADVLVRAGIRSLTKLREAQLQDLETIVTTSEHARRLRHPVTVYQLSTVQRRAWELQDKGMLAGRLLGESGPLKDVQVEIGSRRTRTDDAGRFGFDQLAPGSGRLEVLLPGRTREIRLARCEVIAGKLTGPLKIVLPKANAPEPPIVARHEAEGCLIIPRRGLTPRLATLPLEQFRDKTYFEVRRTNAAGKVVLLALSKVLAGTVIWIQRAEVLPVRLPLEAAPGRILLWSGGQLTLTDLTRKEVAKLRLNDWRARRERTERTVMRWPIH
jgi:hypothetical protein